MAMKKIWYDPAQENYAVFRTGRACWVATSPDRRCDETFAERPISANTYCGLFHFGIVDRLEHLPSALGPIGSHEESVLLPAGLAEAAQILRAGAAELKQDRCDAKVTTRTQPNRREYWMAIDLEAFRTALLDLADFVEAGARQGYAVQFWL
jgi:hypothetical protein